jgi:hypothetical protein
MPLLWLRRLRKNFFIEINTENQKFSHQIIKLSLLWIIFWNLSSNLREYLQKYTKYMIFRVSNTVPFRN